MRQLLRAWEIVQRRLRPSRPDTHEQVREYWRSPPDPGNAPEDYATASLRSSKHLRELIEQAGVSPSAAILEVGCNAGRNLAYLHRQGWTNLAGIDISEQALAVARETFPELADAELICGSLEDVLPAIGDGQFDLVFAMAVLEHVHYDADHVLDHVARVAGSWLITIENEIGASSRHFPRNYRKEFESRGWRQVTEMPTVGINYTFTSRIFQPNGTSR